MPRQYKRTTRGRTIRRARSRAVSRRKTWRSARNARLRRYVPPINSYRITSKLMGQPKRKLIKFRYAQEFTLAAAAGSTTSQIMRANSLYDPDYSGTGHQPLGYDQWSVFYDHYVVIGCKIKVTFDASAESGNSLPLSCGLVLDDNASLSTASTSALTEANNSKTKHFNSLDRTITSITAAVAPHKFLGRSKPLSDPELKAAFNANPVEQCYWVIWMTNEDPATAATYVKCYVDMEYTAVLIEPKDITQS